ncbi:MAG TPA: nicotinate phosphoribosyltransferase [Candidatus Microsaccharimonas sp.]|jgi:nicotinate phosphoribosyltransferase
MHEFLSPEEYNTTPERHLSDGLDYYKLTMGQVALERFPNAEVTFTMKNRAGDFPLSQYVNIDELRGRFDEIIAQGFTTEEITYFAGLKAQNGEARFDESYLDFLANIHLVDVDVAIDEETNDLAISAKGPWANVSLWETIVMSEVNEQYYRNLMKAQELNVEDVWAEGDRRLDEKITKLKARPDIKFSDFGTRRRFSAAWHDHVIGRLAEELPDNFVGTSNPWFAHKHNLAPIGTYAHEMPMVYAGLADAEGRNPLEGHSDMMNDWDVRYNGDLSIALTDTFTSKFFFADFTKEQAEKWHGLRHDSGDPVEFGEQAIKFYKDKGIDPSTKTLVFSDGLDIDTIIALADHFAGRINLMFGWGTTLMNDLGIRANNFVMKATNVNEIDTVKLSDNAGKHTGPISQVERYEDDVRQMVDAVYGEMVTA